MVSRKAGRSTFGAVIGLIGLLAFVLAPAGGAGALALEVDPVIGPERPIAYPVPGTPHDGSEPAVAYGGSVKLVVWSGVLAARVDRHGAVLDPAPIRLPGGHNPVVAFDGANFLVAWENRDVGDGAVEAVRVSPGGEVLDVSPIVLSEVLGLRPAISFDGTDLRVVWWGSSGEIRSTRVSPAGTVLEPDHFLVATPPGVFDQFGIAFNGSHHLLTWNASSGAGYDIYRTLVTPDGVALDPAGVPIPAAGDQWNSTVASIGSSFFVAWQDFRSGANTEIYGGRVDAAGTVVDPTGIPIATGPPGGADPRIASDGTGVLVVWQGSGTGSLQVRGARIDSSGTVLEPSGFTVSTLNFQAEVAFDGDNYFVVGWDDGPIRGARVTPAGAVLDPVAIAVSIGANAQDRADTAFDGTNTFVVWEDTRGQGVAIHGARVGPDGQVLDGQGFPISDGDRATQASVAFDGTNYLVAWIELTVNGIPRAVRAALVSRDGVVLERFDVTVADGSDELFDPAVVFGGGTFLVAWRWFNFAGPGPLSELRAARVTADGVVADPSGLVVGSLPGRVPFDVAFGDTDFLFVWEEQFQFGWDILGARLTPSGTVVPPGRFPVSTGEAQQFAPRVAWNGDRYLVVWMNVGDVDQPDTSDVFGTRLDGFGAVLDPADIPIATGPGRRSAPDVAANGPFLVTWNDNRRRTFYDDLFATRVDPDGTVARPDGFELLTAPDGYWGYGAVVTPAPDYNFYSVVYPRFVADQPYGTTRTFTRWFSPK